MSTLDLQSIHTVLWSPEADQLHVESLADTIQNGQKAFLERRRTDYVLVALASSRYEAAMLAQQLDDNRDDAA